MSWVATAVVGGLTLGTAGTILSATAGDQKVDNTFLQNPEYPHSQDARDLWWNKLQDWGNDPNYGAIAPDWNDIWDQTQKQVRDYYDGSALQPGVQSKIDSSLARRGMSDQPAADFLHAQVGAAESRNLGDLKAQQNIAQNQFAEQGRNDWLGSLQNFQAQKPKGQWNTTVTPNAQQTAGQAISQIGGAVGAAGATLGSLSNQKTYLDSLLQENQFSPQSFGTGLFK